MSVVHRYVREVAADDAAAVDSNVSIDIGTTNMAVARTSRLADTRIRVDHLIIVNLKDADGSDDPDTIGRNLGAVFNASAQQWIWDPPCEILVERQMDQRDQERKKQPIMHCIYSMLERMVADRAEPMLLFPLSVWATLARHGIDPVSEEFRFPQLVWKPRSGSQKTGLKDYRGDDRKDMALIMGPRVLREDGDEAAAEWVESIRPRHKRTGQPLTGKGSRKPMEDACDAVLQSKHRHNEKAGREAVEARKLARATNAQAKRDAKEERRLAREEKKRQLELAREEKKRRREEVEEETKQRPKKRLRRADGEAAAQPAPIDLLDDDD